MTARITIAEENIDEMFQRVAEHLAYINECCDLTLAAYVADQEPNMRKARFFGFVSPYWIEERSPTWQEVDDYRVSLNEWNWRHGRDKKETFDGLYARYETVLVALMNRDVVTLDEAMYNELCFQKEPKSWYRQI